MAKNKNTITPIEAVQSAQVKRKRGIGWFITKSIQAIISGVLLIITFQTVTSFLDSVGQNTQITSLSQISTITAVNVFIIYVVMNGAWKLAKKIFKYDLSKKVADTNVSPEMKEEQARQLSEAKSTAKDFISSLGFGRKAKKGSEG